MCGIVGYIGHQSAAPILIKGLHQLEYRGYNSAGIALMGKEQQTIKVFKAKGKVSNLESKVELSRPDGKALLTTGIGHTRWTTHGEPSETNAHPHLSMSDELAITTEGDDEVKRMVKEFVEIPQTHSCLVPLLSVLSMQLLAYHVAVKKGLNVDMPRNLAKSVTVE